MNSAIAYAFGVGMVATFNPCGFAMLPAYLSYFLGLENTRDGDQRADATVLRALAVGAAMTAGFVVVFGILGLVLEPILSSIIDKLPWVTIVLGIILVVLGIRLLMGREITVRLPKISKGPEGRELGSVFVFGISYALVSLSCTLSLFIAAISTVIDQQNFVVGMGAFIAYALGMGLVLIVLTLAIALARQGIVRKMRGVLPYINRISGVLLVLAGLYVAYYGWYELQVLNGSTSGGGIAGWMFDLNGRITQWISEVGPTRIGLLLGLIIALVVFLALLSKARTDDR
jgi:cytochrome c biogenesis protein CcdA